MLQMQNTWLLNYCLQKRRPTARQQAKIRISGKNRYCHCTTVDAGDMGKGVIANCAYTGEIITLKVYEQRVQEYAKAGAYHIDPFKIGNAAKFVNHSCSPKMIALRWKIDGMDRRFRVIGYFAVEFIMAPLTVNYQFDYDRLEWFLTDLQNISPNLKKIFLSKIVKNPM